VERDLSFDLHALIARLDRAADRILRSVYHLPYRRFLALVVVGGSGDVTQRGLAEALGVTEPSVSRMTGVLVEAGLLTAEPDPAGGHRRCLRLTPAGKDLLERCRELLEGRFAELVDRAGVPYADYARHTRRLIAALDGAPSTNREGLR
jgi:DNA-binding MarR family transcriptional regulator